MLKKIVLDKSLDPCYNAIMTGRQTTAHKAERDNMRLTEKNIDFVKRLEMDRITYGFYVAMKTGKISDSREYMHYENNKTVYKKFYFNQLPGTVKKFIKSHKESVFTSAVFGNGSYTEYIYK